MHQVRIKTPGPGRDKILGEAKKEKLKRIFARRSNEPGLYICEVDQAGKMKPETEQKL